MVTERDHRHRDGRIAALAGRQHGIVTHGQLGSIGLSDSAIRKRVERGRLIAIHSGVYAVGHAALGQDARWLAAVWCCGPAAVLSHRSAAALWGIRPSSSAIIDVTVPNRTGRRERDRLRLHRITRLDHSETTLRQAIPVTRPARTLLDLAAFLTARGLELALERSEQLRLFDLEALERTLENNSGRPGCAVLRAVMKEARVGDTLTRSQLEEAMFLLCRRYGLRPPEVNVSIGPYVADFLWPSEGLIAETDGFGTHGTRAAFESDRIKDAELQLRGYRVVRFTYRRVLRRPRTVAATLGRLLAAGAERTEGEKQRRST